MIGATNKKPRLRKQPGFSSLHLQELILPNPLSSNAPVAMILKANTACGDEDDSLSILGLSSDFYVSKPVPTRRGELQSSLPVGLVYSSTNQPVLNPDKQVQESLRLLFGTFHRTGSATATIKAFHQQGVLFLDD